MILWVWLVDCGVASFCLRHRWVRSLSQPNAGSAGRSGIDKISRHGGRDLGQRLNCKREASLMDRDDGTLIQFTALCLFCSRPRPHRGP